MAYGGEVKVDPTRLQIETARRELTHFCDADYIDIPTLKKDLTRVLDAMLQSLEHLKSNHDMEHMRF